MSIIYLYTFFFKENGVQLKKYFLIFFFLDEAGVTLVNYAIGGTALTQSLNYYLI